MYKKLIFSLTFLNLFLIPDLIAQTDSLEFNLYQTIRNYYSSNPTAEEHPMLQDEEEEEQESQLEHLRKTWEERLYPTGNFKEAANGYLHYGKKSLNNEYLVYPASWDFEGPISSNVW